MVTGGAADLSALDHPTDISRDLFCLQKVRDMEVMVSCSFQSIVSFYSLLQSEILLNTD